MNPNQVLIDSGWKFVLSISGGGQEIIGELTRHGSMSGSFLEGNVPYALPAYHKFVGGKPDQIVSPAAARVAAMASYLRAVEYAPDDKVFGFASTASLVKVGGEREGRSHRVCIAIQDRERTLGVNIIYRPGRTREEEESLTAKLIRVGLMWGCHRFDDMGRFLDSEDQIRVERQVGIEGYRALIHGETNLFPWTDKPKLVFSSSFNPMHDGHGKMIEDAANAAGRPVYLELCIRNADKPPLDYLTIQERVDGIYDYIKKTWGGWFSETTKRFVAGVVLTNKPLFFEKSRLFPEASFIVGSDTFDRILDPKYYPYDGYSVLAGLHDFQENGNRFLVYPRKGYSPVDRISDSVEMRLVRKVTTFVDPDNGYRPSDLSSTILRNATANA